MLRKVICEVRLGDDNLFWGIVGDTEEDMMKNSRYVTDRYSKATDVINEAKLCSQQLGWYCYEVRDLTKEKYSEK